MGVAFSHIPHPVAETGFTASVAGAFVKQKTVRFVAFALLRSLYYSIKTCHRIVISVD